METFYKIRLLLLYTFIFRAKGDSAFSIECSHTFDLNLNLAQILDLNVSTNIKVINSYTSEIIVKSPCCPNITIISNGIKCSSCSENGIKVCNISNEMIEINSIQNAVCERKSDINLSCTSRVCPPRNNTENTEVFRPGEDTGCMVNNNTYTCSKYGNWTSRNCSYEEALQTSTMEPISMNMPNNTSEKTTFANTTEDKTSGNNNTSIDQVTTNKPYNTTDMSTPYNIDTLMFGPNISNETLSEKFEPEKAMKALYTFLIVLGVVLLLVSILVGGFFIRKKKDKVSISHVEYPLEYWHDREYIDNIVEKRFTPNSAFTVNPVFDNKSYGQTRYKKREESDYKKRKGNPDKDQTSGGNERPRRSNAFRTASNGSAASNTDHPRKTKNDYTNKYLATATGSNFYNYSPTQTEDVKKTTDLDVSTEDECDRARDRTGQSGTSSFKSSKKRAKHRNANRDARDDPNDRWDEHGPDVVEDNIYSVSYKEHLRRSLDYWSAEESDA